jgi:outer membrane biosynthesis protein TonB
MSKDSRFWRNVTLIALAHVALIAGLIRWSVEARSSSTAQSVVWLGDVGGASAATEPMIGEPQPAKLSPSPEPRRPKSDEAEKQEPLLTAAKSEIELPTPTPTPTPTSTPKTPATPTAKPRATPKPALKPTPKPTPKKRVLAKASPKAKSSPTKSAEKAKQADANAEKKKIAKAASAKNGSLSQNSTGKGSSAGKGGHAAGEKSASEFAWYGNMLHDRFYSAWTQPTTTVASGAKISTLVKVRIEKDGRVSSFEIIKPSENILVNESVAAIAKRVTEVDPVPSGLGNGDHYDVKINFELNTDQETAH